MTTSARLDDIWLGADDECTDYLFSGTTRGYVTATTDYLAAVAWLTWDNSCDGRELPLGSAGDVDADGFADLPINQDAYARALLFYGPITGSHDPEEADSFIQPTYAVGTAMDHADMNGDGYSDLLLGSSAADLNGTDSGGVYILAGGLGL